MSISRKCVFYCEHLQKPLPILLIPNKLYTFGNFDKCAKVYFDDTRYTEYSTNKYEIDRYCEDLVKLIDIYPTETVDELNYANACMPRAITVNHVIDEFNRMKKLVDILTDVPEIKKDFFYKLADFISYDLLFSLCTQDERVFLLTICTIIIPVEMIPNPFTLGSMILMIKRIFDKFPAENTVVYNIQNIKNLSEFEYITFPLQINIPTLRTNVQFIYDNIAW